MSSLQVTEPWHKLPRGCGVSSLEPFRSRLDVVLGTLLWVALLEQGLGWGLLRSLPTSVLWGSVISPQDLPSLSFHSLTDFLSLLNLISNLALINS